MSRKKITFTQEVYEIIQKQQESTGEPTATEVMLRKRSVDHNVDENTELCEHAVRRSVSEGEFPISNSNSKVWVQYPFLDCNVPLDPSQVDQLTVEGLNTRDPSLRSRSLIRITEVVPINSSLVLTADSQERIHSPTDGTSWRTSLKVFTDTRSRRQDGTKLNRRIRSYYKDQDELIKAYEDIQMDTPDWLDPDEMQKRKQNRAQRLAQISFLANLILLLAKCAAVAMSSSISIISSLVDSIMDLMSGIIIWITSKAMKNRNIHLYPGGKSRLEPIAIVILSVLMSLASFQLIVESLKIIVLYVSNEGTVPSVQIPVILIAVFTIVIKFILFILCYCLGRESPSVVALQQDHRNDVLSNLVAIVCGYFGSQEFLEKVDVENLKYIDPVGAILISVYISFNWWRTGYDQIKLLTGFTADPSFLSKITWICLNHHRDIIFIDTVRAFHFGNNYLVEVDIVLPEDMTLKVAHNIGESLQQKLEKFQLVDRAFVHLDYEFDHNPLDEHKIV